MIGGASNIKSIDKDFSCRLILKYHNNFKYPEINGNGNDFSFLKKYNFQWQQLFKQFPGLQVNKLFTSLPRQNIIELLKKATRLDPAYQETDLFSYFSIVYREETDRHALLQAILQLEGIELAYTQGGTDSPSVNTEMDQINLAQEYLNAAPEGINAKYAWQFTGGKGKGNVKFIDIEQGWDLGDDLTDIKTLPLTGIIEEAFRDHGSAVLQVIMKKENTTGSIGIVPEATGYIVSQWRPDGSPNDADAILSAISYLNFGDIILLEAQSYYSGTNKLWPLEIQDACFAVIRLATALGIIVIEAGGNGNPINGDGTDLDLFELNGKKIFNPAARDFKDSGAIIVAAATLNNAHERIRYSNYGSRINCYAWGEGVMAFEHYSQSPGSSIKTSARKLNGTSGAAAIITGAAIAVQNISETKHNIRLSPKQMRNVLSSGEYGTASAGGNTSDKIGVMPDLKKIIDNFLHAAPV